MPTTRSFQTRDATTALSRRTEFIQLVRLLARQAAREAVLGATQQDASHAQHPQDPDQD